MLHSLPNVVLSLPTRLVPLPIVISMFNFHFKVIIINELSYIDGVKLFYTCI